MGWFRVEDSVFDHPAFRDHAERMLWLKLISQASWRRRTVRYRDRMIVLERGQVAMTLRDMAAFAGFSKGKAEKFLKRLENEAMIETEAKTGVSVITILNYNNYQSPDNRKEDADEDTSEDSAKTPRRQCEDEERTRLHDNTVKGCVARARVTPPLDSEPDANVSHETISVCEAWAAFRGSDVISPGERIQIAAAIRRHGLHVLLAVIDRARGSPRLRGETKILKGGMPLRWLFEDERIAQILRGEHDGDDGANEQGGRDGVYQRFLNRSSAAGEVDELWPGSDCSQDGDGAGGESVPYLRLAAGR